MRAVVGFAINSMIRRTAYQDPDQDRDRRRHGEQSERVTRELGGCNRHHQDHDQDRPSHAGNYYNRETGFAIWLVPPRWSAVGPISWLPSLMTSVLPFGAACGSMWWNNHAT